MKLEYDNNEEKINIFDFDKESFVNKCNICKKIYIKHVNECDECDSKIVSKIFKKHFEEKNTIFYKLKIFTYHLLAWFVPSIIIYYIFGSYIQLVATLAFCYGLIYKDIIYFLKEVF